MTGIIRVLNFANLEPDRTVTNKEILISSGPLSNPFNVGEANMMGRIITDQYDALSAYRDYLHYKITKMNPIVCAALNEIGVLVMEGTNVDLVFVGPVTLNHGYVIKETINEAIKRTT